MPSVRLGAPHRLGGRGQIAWSTGNLFGRKPTDRRRIGGAAVLTTDLLPGSQSPGKRPQAARALSDPDDDVGSRSWLDFVVNEDHMAKVVLRFETCSQGADH